MHPPSSFIARMCIVYVGVKKLYKFLLNESPYFTGLLEQRSRYKPQLLFQQVDILSKGLKAGVSSFIRLKQRRGNNAQ